MSGDWFLHCDNVPIHTALIVRQTENKMLFFVRTNEAAIEREAVFLTLQKFNELPWQPLTKFQIKISYGIFWRGGVATAVSSHMGNSLKEIELSDVYIYINMYTISTLTFYTIFQQFAKLLIFIFFLLPPFNN